MRSEETFETFEQARHRSRRDRPGNRPMFLTKPSLGVNVRFHACHPIRYCTIILCMCVKNLAECLQIPSGFCRSHTCFGRVGSQPFVKAFEGFEEPIVR